MNVETYENLYPSLFGYAYSLTKNRSDAEDLVSETVLQCIQSNAEPDNIKAWCIRVLKNKFLSSKRKKTEELIEQDDPYYNKLKQEEDGDDDGEEEMQTEQQQQQLGDGQLPQEPQPNEKEKNQPEQEQSDVNKAESHDDNADDA